MPDVSSGTLSSTPATSYARQFHEKLWQRYGFEHVLRDEETTQVVAAYVVGNPVRAGLVRRVLDYPFVGSFVYDLSDLL